MIAAFLANARLYAGIAGILALLGSYAAVYNAGYRARSTRDHTEKLQAQLEAAKKNNERLELSAKLVASETRLLEQYRGTLQERVHELEEELTAPRDPVEVAVPGPVVAASCPAVPSPYRASSADIARMQRARAGQPRPSPAARPGVQPSKGGTAESR